MSRRQRRQRQKRKRRAQGVGVGRHGRVAVGTGLSLGAALGMAPAAEAVNFLVTSTANTGGGSLREAITASEANNNGPTVDQISFQSGLSGTITLASELPTVAEPLEIFGPGATTLTVSGNNTSRILSVGATDLTISGLTLAGGNSAGVNGGAISSQGNLTIQDSTLSGNTSSTGAGGAIFQSGGSLTLRRSTLSGNTSTNLGAGLRAFYTGTVTIEDSTISDNPGSAPAISIRGSASPVIEGTTISGNAGFGIYGYSTADIPLTSTIVANNGGTDISAAGSGAPTFNLAFSLVEDTSGATITQPGPNVLGSDPQLGAPAMNGGTTATQLPATTSPAIDKGSDTGPDQRGLARPFDVPTIGNASGGNGADIGAVELQASNFPSPAAAPKKKKKKCKKKKKKGKSAAAAKKCKKKKKK